MQVLSERTVAEMEDGFVTVEKAVLDLARENIVGIKLTIRSNAEEPVTVRLVEEFPGHVSMSDIQAHPSYHPERWSVSEGRHRMTFETAVRPGESIETIYGVRVTDGDLEPFVGEPALHSRSEGSDRTAGSTAAEASDPGADVAEGPVPEEPKPASEPGAAESFEFGEDRARVAATGGEAGSGADHGASARSSTTDASADALIEALTRTELSEAQRDSLRDAIDLKPAESQRIQLAQLQTSVARLSAFADEFERFVDAVGQPANAIDDLRSSHDRLVGTVDDLAASVQAAEADQEAVRSGIDRVVDTVDELADSVRDAAADREAIRAEIDRLEAEQASLGEDLSTEMADLDARLNQDLTTEVDSLDARVSELEAVLGAEEFEGIRAVIAAERTWRQRLEASRARRPMASTSGQAER